MSFNHLTEEERAGCFALVVVFLLSCRVVVSVLGLFLAMTCMCGSRGGAGGPDPFP